MKLLLVSLLIFFSISSSLADWGAGALDWAQRFDSEPVKFKDPYVMMSWAALKAHEISNIHDHKWFIPNSHFKAGGIHVSVQLQRKLDQSLKTAPLMIALPGIFSGFDGAAAKRTSRDFGKRGYHIVLPPNPWSLEYIRAIPDHNPGTLRFEAELILELIDSAIQKIGMEHVSRVELSGESYGAILAAAVFELDQQRPSPVIDGDLTLFSPPIDMNEAIANLDAGIDRTQSVYEARCRTRKDDIDFGGTLMFHSEQSRMDQETVFCSEPLVFHSFQERLVQSVELLHQLKNLGTIPTDPAELEKWEKNFRFARVIPDFTPENAGQLKDGTASLIRWLGLLPANSMARIRVISAQDDFLNQGIAWPVGDGVITPRNLIEMPWGGHAGYIMLSEFQRLLDAGFNY